MAAAPVLPASTTMSDPVGQHAIEHGHRVAVAHTRAVERRRAAVRCAPRRRAPAAPVGRPAPDSAVGQHAQRRPQVVGVDVGARQVRRRRSDRDRRHRGQRVVEAGARGHRQSGADHQAHRAVGHRVGHTGMAHHTGHTERRRRTEAWCTRDILGVGHAWPPARAAPPAARSSSARASSRATCSPAMIVTGPVARRSARTIGCGSPTERRRISDPAAACR